jgi:hypothetical protein
MIHLQNHISSFHLLSKQQTKCQNFLEHLRIS